MLLPAENTLGIRREGHAPDLGDLVGAAGMSLSDGQLVRLKRYRDLLFDHNQTTNLTAIREPAGIDRRLILESLRLVAPLRALPRINESPSRSLIDIGTGGGLPGMVLAIACPEFNVSLLEATARKVVFLDLAIGELGLERVVAINARAEDLGCQPRFRSRFDVVTARAVSSLPALLELGLPLLRVGGSLMLPKGADIGEELEAAERAATILGGEVVDSGYLPDVGSTVATRLVIVRKIAATPLKYPRRSGIPSKSPLGIRQLGGTSS